ncbi:uncharacterized protein LOC105420519 [Amborella trichopoda]|uniref:uncharacterized protein LOC105420519 n=1 Tax=Amborella trichopoda TaxID=13333 RepID=UPI0005D3850C|nr:uncharacterized protein LOC105420519 [Amborella trichopoda]|eukprot:XP_011622765.1 uncharacterized protein LOC105420519 [Amborella trichopoda]
MTIAFQLVVFALTANSSILLINVPVAFTSYDEAEVRIAVGVGVPICVQCGTHSNPCRCKVVGPTLGFLAFAAAAVVEWPVGAVVYLFRHMTGRRIMAHPVTVVYPSVSNAIPI